MPVSEKLLLIDGQSFCYRAFYAIRELSNSKGEPTNAIYGFATMLKKLMDELAPTHIAVCFDSKAKTFRHAKYEAYKAHRKPMPDSLVSQMPHIKKLVHAYRIASFELPGYEADDLIGTLAHKADFHKWNVLIVTNDKDAMQLVNDRVRIFNPYKEIEIGEEEVRKQFNGVGPKAVVEIMGLMGDQSDNIPGVPGIGEKTAVGLIEQYGSIEGVMKHINDIKGEERRRILKENEKLAYLSRDLAVIDREVPIDADLEKLKLQKPNEEELAELFKHFEFRSLLKELSSTATSGEENREYHAITTREQLKKFVGQIKKAKALAVDTETTSTDPMRAHLVGISFSWRALEAYYIPVSSKHHAGSGLDVKDVLSELKPFLEDEDIKKYGQNIKYDLVVLKRHGINLKGLEFDTMIASYLINPSKFNHNLDDISFDYLGVKKIATADLLGSGRNQITMDQVPLQTISQYACEDADCVFRLVELLRKLLHVHTVEKVFHEMDMPLLEVLAVMEQNGVKLDLDILKDLSKRAEHDLEKLTGQIYKEAGEEFNINSTKQLSDILFTKLKLPVIKRTKTGYSTDTSVLERLAQSYELPKLLLDYREKSKLKSTYLDAFPELVHPETHLIHTSFNQTVTSTGRLSSSDPNLQNIPIRTETGREIRRAFVPRKKQNRILSADYSQIELRILAHMSEDKNLTKAFQDDMDVHVFTATLLYSVQAKDVTREMRDAAKTINFSIVYGVSAYGLAQSLNISVPEGQTFIDSYFARYPKVKEFLDSQRSEAKEKGFLTTIFGRRSYFPEINSPNANVRQFAERAAINAPIQGTAADLIKVAMIHIQAELEKQKYESLMIIQVHDELVFDCPKDEIDSVTTLVKREMEGACRLKVPLRVDTRVGESWFKD